MTHRDQIVSNLLLPMSFPTVPPLSFRAETRNPHLPLFLVGLTISILLFLVPTRFVFAAPLTGANADMSLVRGVGSPGTDITAGANDITTDDVIFGNNVLEAVKFGMTGTFSGLVIDLTTAGGGSGTVNFDYCSAKDGSNVCSAWSALTVTSGSLTTALQSTGIKTVTFTVPSVWPTAKLDSSESPERYWVRIETFGTYSGIVPRARQVSANLVNPPGGGSSTLPPDTSYRTSPVPGTPTALSTTSIRWPFTSASGYIATRMKLYKKFPSGSYELVEEKAGSWPPSTPGSFDETGLMPNTKYSMTGFDGARAERQLQAYGTSPGTSASISASGLSDLSVSFAAAATMIEQPVSVTPSNITSSGVTLRLDVPILSNLTVGQSGVKFNCVLPNASVASAQSEWQQTTSWIATGLAPGTAYTCKAKARNQDGVETAWGPEITVATATTTGNTSTVPSGTGTAGSVPSNTSTDQSGGNTGGGSDFYSSTIQTLNSEGQNSTLGTADGNTVVTVLVTARSGNQPLPGALVEVALAGLNGAIITPAGARSGTNGQVSFALSSTTSGSVVIGARVNGVNIGQAIVIFLPAEQKTRENITAEFTSIKDIAKGTLTECLSKSRELELLYKKDFTEEELAGVLTKCATHGNPAEIVRVLAAERRMIGIFQQIMKRKPKSPTDWLLIHGAAYGVRPLDQVKDAKVERKADTLFRKVSFKYKNEKGRKEVKPHKAGAILPFWKDILRALAYYNVPNAYR